MNHSAPEPAASADVYLLCLAAQSRGLLSGERLAECLERLKSLPPGTESFAAVIEGGFLTASAVAELRALSRLSDGMEACPVAMRADAKSLATTKATSSSPAHSVELFGAELEIHGTIGRGAMGVVYRARDRLLNRWVALKVLDPVLAATPEQLERFRIEAQALARMAHPSIVGVHRVGENDGRHFISMDLVEGINLAAMIEQGLPPRRAMEIALELARALDAAHQQGVLHRDVKPGNVMVDVSGRVRLLDFGLARLDDGGVRGTRLGELVGTPAYISPEQAAGRTTDCRSDVFSLGATLYHMLSARAPRQHLAAVTTFHLAASQEAPLLVDVAPKASRDAAALCARAMHWSPDQRYASAGEMADDIERYLNGEAVRARPLTVLYRLSRWLHRRRALVGKLLVTATLLLLGAIGTGLWRDHQAAREALARAREEAAGGNYVAAIASLRGVATHPLWGGLRGQAREGLIVAMHKLGYSVAAVSLFERGPAALDEILPGHPVLLAQELIDRQQLPAVLRFLRNAVVDLGGSRTGFELGRHLAAIELALGDLGSARSRLKALKLSSHLSLVESAELEARERVLEAVGERSRTLILDAADGTLFAQALGDVDGDNGTDFLGVHGRSRDSLGRFGSVPGPCRLMILALTRANAAASADLDIPFGEASLELVPRSLIVGNVDAQPGNEIVIYSYGSTAIDRGRLDCFRLVGGDLHRVAAPIWCDGGNAADERQCAMQIADVTWDEMPDVLLGLASSSGAATGRRTLVFENPFWTERTTAIPVHLLPRLAGEPAGKNDTSSVLAVDVDGDGKLEAAYTTSSWMGHDLRVYRRGAASTEPFEILCSSGPIGSMGASAGIDLNGDGASEIVVATHSYHAYNTRVFPLPPHTGMPPGVHVYALQRESSDSGLQLLYSDLLRDQVVDPPEMLRCLHLSAAWFAGKPAILASWCRWDDRRRISFVDLHVLESDAESGAVGSKSAYFFRRHRIFWSDDFSRARGDLVDIDGDGEMEILILTTRRMTALQDDYPDAPGPTTWELSLWRPTAAVVDGKVAKEPGDVLLSVLESYIDDRRYEEAFALANHRAPLAPGSLSKDLVRLWARAAGRARRWDEVRKAISALPVSDEGLTAGDAELAMWTAAALEGIALRNLVVVAESFRSDPAPLWELGGAGVTWLPRQECVRFESPRFAASRMIHGASLARPVTILRSGAFALSLDLSLEKLGWNRNVFVGIVQQAALQNRTRSGFFGFELRHGGGEGLSLRSVAIVWNAAAHWSMDRKRILMEGRRYRFRLEYSPPEQRVRLRVEDLTGNLRGFEPLGLEWPPDGVAAAMTPQGESDNSARMAVPPGEYGLGVFEEILSASPEAVDSPVILQVEALELRAQAAVP